MTPFRNVPLPLGIAVLSLTACATPQERCILRETRDLRVVEALIVEAQDNLKRGYALEEVTTVIPQWKSCRETVQTPEGETRVVSRLCLEDEIQTTTRPKAIDLDAEARTLRSLERKRTDLLGAARLSKERCIAAFPE